MIHLCSSAARAPFEKCAGRDLQRSALETAAATAAGGTLFIDAIDALPAQTAFALTEILDAKTDLRVIGGAAGLLEAQNALPADVFYHLSTAQAHVPALSERPEDIPVLFRHYVAQAAEQSGTPAPQIDPQTLAQLVAQDWPGNARALMSAAMRFVLGVGTAAGAETLAGGQAQGHAAAPAQGQSLSAQMAQVERSLLMAALERAGGQASVAAKDLSLPRKTFYDKLARYEIKPEDFRS